MQKKTMKTKKLLVFPHKVIRAKVIKQYMSEYGYRRAVGFSCGHASEALKMAGIETLAVAPNGDLEANRWFRQGEIAEKFQGFFDATSGHLPFELMNLIAAEYKRYLGEIPMMNYIPCGSGETVICLKMAYPDRKFFAVYNIDESTKYEENAPLNSLVRVVAEKVIMEKTSE